MDDLTDHLIDRIWESALHPEEWQAVAEGFSAIFGGSPVSIGLLIPNVAGLHPRYVTGLPLEGAVRFLEYVVEQPNWSREVFLRYADGFRYLSEDFGHLNLASTSFYAEWMEPRGLSPDWPVGHMLLSESNQSLGGFFVFQRAGEAPFSEIALAAASHLVPHLRRSVRIQARLGSAQHARLALGEVVDRLPVGVLLLDAKRRVVVRNQAAQRIIEQNDGLRVDDNGISADDARQNAVLQKRIADALDETAERGVTVRIFTVVPRDSGKRDFTLMVSPLFASRAGSAASDVALAIFVVDPHADTAPGAEILEQVYSLTHSEAQIVRMLSLGLSLEEAARSRGVTIHTARSHLKHAFSKTGTSRQGELVRLIVSGIGAIGDA